MNVELAVPRPPGTVCLLLDLKVEVMVEDPEWDQLMDRAERLCEQAARHAVSAVVEQLDHTSDEPLLCELSVLLTGDAQSRDLNRDFRGIDKPTNVLSFPMDGLGSATCGDGAPRLLGDLVLASGVCVREAAAQGKQLSDHVRHLIVHGALHLLGHDHESDEDAEIMETVEVQVLEGLGVANPYASDFSNGVEEAPQPR